MHFLPLKVENFCQDSIHIEILFFSKNILEFKGTINFCYSLQTIAFYEIFLGPQTWVVAQEIDENLTFVLHPMSYELVSEILVVIWCNFYNHEHVLYVDVQHQFSCDFR
jgi:hypothetical protein